MSLYFTLRVNLDQSLGMVSITRLTHRDLPGEQAAGTENTYEVRLDGKKMGTVSHHYDAGAFALASKALALIDVRTKWEPPSEQTAKLRGNAHRPRGRSSPGA